MDAWRQDVLRSLFARGGRVRRLACFRKTPADFMCEWERPARRFLERHGATMDFTLGALVLGAVAFCIGYAFGVGAR